MQTSEAMRVLLTEIARLEAQLAAAREVNQLLAAAYERVEMELAKLGPERNRFR
jgi:hypothetical protein